MNRPAAIALALFVACSTAACNRSTAPTDTGAQPGAPGAMSQGGPQRMHRFGRVLETLGLSDSQKAQIRTIMTNVRAKNRGVDTETRRANMKEAFAQIDAILTPAQRTQLHAKLQAMRTHPETQPSPSQ